jgi:signal transduction histidine kinase
MLLCIFATGNLVYLANKTCNKYRLCNVAVDRDQSEIEGEMANLKHALPSLYNPKYARFYRRVIIATFVFFTLIQVSVDHLLHKVPLIYTFTLSALVESSLALVIVLLALQLAGKQQRELSQTRAVRDELASALANDLRQPLVTVVAALRELENAPELPPTTERHIEQALASAQPLIGMTVELLGLTAPQEETAQAKQQFQQLNCLELLKAVLPAIQTVANTRGIEVQTQIPASPLNITGMPHSLFRAFTILLDNAVRTTPNGGQVSIVAHPATPQQLEILITDGGPPVSAEVRQAIEGAEEAGNTAEISAYAPTRLGLRYCAAVIHTHQGRISVESLGNHGNIVKVMLPTVSTPTSNM